MSSNPKKEKLSPPFLPGPTGVDESLPPPFEVEEVDGRQPRADRGRINREVYGVIMIDHVTDKKQTGLGWGGGE